MGAWPGAGVVAGIEAGVGPDGDECLEFADDAVEGQAWRGGFLGHSVRFEPCRRLADACAGPELDRQAASAAMGQRGGGCIWWTPQGSSVIALGAIDARMGCP